MTSWTPELASPLSPLMADAIPHFSSNSSWVRKPNSNTLRRHPNSTKWNLHYRSLCMTAVAPQNSPDYKKKKIDGIAEREREKEEKERERKRKEEVNKKIASKKAISVILRREATKAVMEKKRGTNSKKLLPRTVLEALHERIKALRWESALKV